jgi:Flp pilus assembly protein TadB
VRLSRRRATSPPRAARSKKSRKARATEKTKASRKKRSRGRNRPLGALFVVLALSLVGVAVAALRAEVWVVAFAAAVLAFWLGSLALRLLSLR